MHFEFINFQDVLLILPYYDERIYICVCGKCMEDGVLHHIIVGTWCMLTKVHFNHNRLHWHVSSESILKSVDQFRSRSVDVNQALTWELLDLNQNKADNLNISFSMENEKSCSGRLFTHNILLYP